VPEAPDRLKDFYPVEGVALHDREFGVVERSRLAQDFVWGGEQRRLRIDRFTSFDRAQRMVAMLNP
jgi:hypothetical protein